MILVFGSVNIDLVARVPSIPRPGETVLAPGYETLHGGKGANQAVAAARASRGSGVAVAIAARVGEDGFGRAALDNLCGNGVDTAFVGTGPEPTGCAFITVESGGENAITVASGANAALTAEACASHAFTAADILVLQMEVPFREALRVARRARSAGARIVWNYAPAPAAFAEADLRDLLAATDVFVANDHEIAAAARLLGLGEGDAEPARGISRATATLVVHTRGSRGAVASLADGRSYAADAAPVRVVDTTGAGDTFVGVLAAELADGQGIGAALARACLAASIACETPGAQDGMPDRPTLDAREADHGRAAR